METNEREKQYNKLKLSLETMGYKGYLSEESVQLVNSVLSDLIKATKAFKNIMLEKNNLESKLRVQDDIIIPLRNENYKISKDNNELHKEIIKLKDDLELRNTSENSKVNALQRAIDEIQFVVEQKNQLIHKYSYQNEILRNKLNRIFDCLYLGEGDRAIINEKGLEKERKFISNINPESINTIFKKKSFEITENLYSNKNEIYLENNNLEILEAVKQEMNNIKVSKQDWSDDLKKAEIEMENNRNEIKSLRDELEQKDKILNQYKKIIEEREKEIGRLQGNIYYGDDNKDELKLRYQSEFIKEENDKLQSQIEFLNRKNLRLNAIDYFHSHRCREEEVKRLDAEIARLTKENEKLKKSLDNMGLGDLNSSIMTGNKSFMNRSRFSFYSSTNLSDQVKKLKADKKTLLQLLEKEKEKNQELTKELMVSKDENIEKLSNVNKEKENLQNKLEELQKQNSELKEQK